jgi:hypothetical protein
MDIGEEEETTVIEPIKDPVPARRESPEPTPERTEPEREPEREKVATWPRQDGQVASYERCIGLAAGVTPSRECTAYDRRGTMSQQWRRSRDRTAT